MPSKPDAHFPDYRPPVAVDDGTLSPQRRKLRDDELQTFEAAYSRIFYDYYRRVQGELFKEHSKAADFILDSIVQVSRSNQDISNFITHALLYLSNRTGSFSTLYASSRGLRQLRASAKDHLNEALSDAARAGKKSLFNWALATGETVLLKIVSSPDQVAAYWRRKHIFPRITADITPTEHLVEAYRIVTTEVMSGPSATSEPIRDFLLLIPVASPSMRDEDSILALFIGFLGAELKSNQEHAWPRSHAELDQIALALLPFLDLGAVYEIQREREKNRILDSTRQLTTLFVHSFGQCSRRVSSVGDELEDASVLSKKGVAKLTAELRSVASDLKAIKRQVLAPLSELQWGRTGRLDEAVRIALHGFEETFKINKIKYLADLDAVGAAIIAIDSLILGKILENVFENAVKALATETDDRRIELHGWCDLPQGSSISLEIADNGCGLPPGYDRWIYKTKGRSEWKSGQSTGVGLFASHALLKMFGGDIRVENSKRPGMSTSVTLELPVDQ